jgi:hypothetical protein
MCHASCFTFTFKHSSKQLIHTCQFLLNLKRAILSSASIINVNFKECFLPVSCDWNLADFSVNELESFSVNRRFAKAPKNWAELQWTFGSWKIFRDFPEKQTNIPVYNESEINYYLKNDILNIYSVYIFAIAMEELCQK